MKLQPTDRRPIVVLKSECKQKFDAARKEFTICYLREEKIKAFFLF